MEKLWKNIINPAKVEKYLENEIKYEKMDWIKKFYEKKLTPY